MKKLIIILTMITIATPALARHECKPHIKKYWRSAFGANIVLIGWRCKGSGNGMSVDQNNICGRTENGTVTCADGWSRLSLTGQDTKLRFDRTDYPIEHIFIKH